jgi:hypothetical protein
MLDGSYVGLVSIVEQPSIQCLLKTCQGVPEKTQSLPIWSFSFLENKEVITQLDMEEQ